MQTTRTATHRDERDAVEHLGPAVEVRYLDGDEVTLRIVTPAEALDADAGAELLARAVSHVRYQRTRVVRTALDASAPAAGVMLEALRSRVGADVGEIALRRAGSSVMVTMHLLPVATPGLPGHVPGHLSAGRLSAGRGARSSTPPSTRPRPVPHRAPHAQERSR